MSATRPFSLEVGDGRELFGVIHIPEQPGPRPTVVVCHGFKGFMEWGFFPFLAELLAERGFTVVRFNFPGSGMRPGDVLVTDTEAFRRATFSQDLNDLGRVLNALGTQIGEDTVDPQRIGLFGHSRGGGIATLAAAQESRRGRLRALVTWAAVSTFDRLTLDEKEIWRRRGDLTVVNSRTGQQLAIDAVVLEDLERFQRHLDPSTAASTRLAPWLILHGDQDETVPWSEARLLASHAAAPCELRVIPNGDHTFGAKHPFAGPTPQLVEALNATQEWFRRHLG
ncbi:MAG: alpha/beta fold hydrolase [Bacteroidia bacterium]|nr:alpha/beta fold hydrolase [Bacteroidia bacterium]